MRKAALTWALAVTCASPLHAQTVETGPTPMNGVGPVSMGSFAGARIQIPLGGKRGEKQVVRAGLTIAPMLHREGSDLKGPAWRIGDGLEFGFRSDEAKPFASLGGQRLTPTAGGRGATKARNNLSDVGTVAVVVGGIAVLAGIGWLVALDAMDERCCE